MIQKNAEKGRSPTCVFKSKGKLSAALRAIGILRRKQKPAIGAISTAAVCHDQMKILLSEGNSFTMLDGTPQGRSKGIHRSTAIRLGIICFSPTKQGKEEQAEIRIDHENRNAAEPAAFFADHGLPEKIKVFFALRDPADEKHKSHILTINFLKSFYNNLFP